MIDFKLLKKDDFAILINGFDTSFLQMPMKRPAKSLQKYIPNGFRPEKLNRNQLNKVYVEALSDGEQTLAAFVNLEIKRNFENIGIETYFVEKEITPQDIPKCIIEISNIVFENDLVIPAHIVLMLYGFECIEEEKELSQHLHNVFHEKSEGAREAGIECGIKHSEEKASGDLESEQKKSAKLQKNLDAAIQKNTDAAGKIKLLQEENKELTNKVKEMEKFVLELEKSKSEADKYVAQLSQKDSEHKKTIVELTTKLEELKTRNKELQEEVSNQVVQTVSEDILLGDTLKKVCQDAIKMLDSDSDARKEALEKARQIFVNEEDVKEAWELLCNKTTDIIEEICELLIDGEIEDEDIDKFTELDGLLLLENVIQTALLSVAYKALSSSAIDGTSHSDYKVNGEEME